LADARSFRGKDSILSGPAGGIVGMARTAQAAGFGRVIGFDMGGTSTDVSHFAGEFERQYETQVAGVRMRAPMLAIHTVAAGAGSILHFDGSRYRAGPDSAGAVPGPAAYRRGGPLTVTDANIMLGRIQASHFPAVFGPGGDQPLDTAVVAAKFAALAAEIGAATGQRPRPAGGAAGFLAIAVANMANAIKKISVQRGYDVTRYVLATFGGAGGQHACAVADALAIETVLIHPLAGVLSAYGMGLADVTAMREQAVEAPLAESLLGELGQVAAGLEAGALAELAGAGADPARATRVRRAHLRYEGTATALPVPLGAVADMTAGFERAYRQQFSFLMPGKAILVEAVSVEVVVPSADGSRGMRPAAGAAGNRAEIVRMHVNGRWADVPLARRRGLRPREGGGGPAVIAAGVGSPGGGHGGRGRGGAATCCWNASRPGPGAAPPAPRWTRSCWRSSITCSCRWPSRWGRGCGPPRTRSTSRNGSTSPARSSTPAAGSSPTPRTCRCTSGRWGSAPPRSPRATPGRCGPATCTC